MSVFVDSSALVKRYADEHGHEVIRAINGMMVVSQLTRVEVPAALWRKQRMGEISAEQAQILCQDFEADFYGVAGAEPHLASVPPAAPVLDVAARLCATHGLRAYDAVQLGTALAVREVEPSCHTLAAFDSQLRQAAAIEGFSLLPAA